MTVVAERNGPDADQERRTRCPGCATVLVLDHETMLSGVRHAGCSRCHQHYLWADSWMPFGGCQACTPN